MLLKRLLCFCKNTWEITQGETSGEKKDSGRRGTFLKDNSFTVYSDPSERAYLTLRGVMSPASRVMTTY